MAVSITSRYRGLAVYDAVDACGTVHPTVEIRRHTAPPADSPDFRHHVTGTEQIEDLAWRFYGHSDAWWCIADANPLAFPLDLRPGDAVAVPATPGIGRVDRERVL
ncbi:hypothetical protein [Streptomyces sp. NBC_01445]|uniref:hypothetical protein n=1 Tax=Streptomyces sp. NBC_01445 TaxID=2903869 RepID=UPI002DDB7C7F|nr:hypothetical protein [Streptomyces sp. NBC_01445]WSE03779.1 hypothetical protein OG574_10605 [Streptomyces sp. NBC_01445]